MYLLIHGVLTLSYLSASLLVGYGLYSSGIVADTSSAILIGISVLLMGMLIHQGAARARRDRILAEAISTMEQSQHRIAEEVASSRDDINTLATAAELGMRHKAVDDYGSIVAEVKTLETLVRQISDQPVVDAAPPFMPDGDNDRTAPDAPETADAPLEAAPTVRDDLDGEELLDVIRDALNENRVDIYLQPVVSLPQRKPSYYETFSRLRDAGGGRLEPSRYIEAAEQSGLITAIDNNLLFRCVQLVRKSQRRRLNFGFFCNISHYTLQDTSFFPEFIEFMQQNTGLAENLIFEFGQADLASHDRYITRNLAHLGDFGFRFSVDRVENLDIDVDELVARRVSFVKVGAKTALDALRDSDRSLQFYRVKHALERAGIQLIVEKIEEEENLVELLDYGINFGQGYLFGTPRLSREI